MGHNEHGKSKKNISRVMSSVRFFMYRLNEPPPIDANPGFKNLIKANVKSELGRIKIPSKRGWFWPQTGLGNSASKVTQDIGIII